MLTVTILTFCLRNVCPKMTDYILPLEASPHRKVMVGVGDVESAYFLQVVPSLSSYHDEDLPALMVLIQYLTQCEGPMWCQIRGLGLSYHYRWEGLFLFDLSLFFSFYLCLSLFCYCLVVFMSVFFNLVLFS